ncbi:MAG: glycosyltransferase family 4 protein [Chloroflexi bacterium]|nr:glycosyltransferase family 4 protein [Chloroflexota bacterium]
MRILFLTNYYPPFEVGGYEQLCRDVAVRLSQRGHRIAVLTSDHITRETMLSSEASVSRLLRTQPARNARLSIAAQFLLTRRRAERHNRSIFRETAREFGPDIVFIWNLQGLPYDLALDAEALPGIAVAYWLAGYTPAEPDLFWRYWMQPPPVRAPLLPIKRFLSKIALAQMKREGRPVHPHMHHVGVVSEYMKCKGLAEGTLPPHARVIHNGVETDVFYRDAPPPDAPLPTNLLIAGRVSPDKGIHVAIDAVEQLARSRPQRDFRLLIAGDGPAEYLAYLHKRAEGHNVTDLVSFLGWLPRERIPAVMHDSHILLLTTIHPEPFARVVLEGMAAGLAVVGTLTGGTGELLQDGVNGLSCAAEDAGDLARQVGRLLDGPQLRHRLARQGQDTVLAHYTLDHMVEQLEILLTQAVAEQTQQIDR